MDSSPDILEERRTMISGGYWSVDFVEGSRA